MKEEEIYGYWKERKRGIEVSEGLAERAMIRIYEYEHVKGKGRFDVHGLIERISAHPWAIGGLVAAGAVIGLLRVAYGLLRLLGPCSYCG